MQLVEEGYLYNPHNLLSDESTNIRYFYDDYTYFWDLSLIKTYLDPSIQLCIPHCSISLSSKVSTSSYSCNRQVQRIQRSVLSDNREPEEQNLNKEEFIFGKFSIINLVVLEMFIG